VPDQPARITIRAEQRANHWVFSVADNGIGINPRFFEKIFVMFQRLHARESYTGTGVGLAVCKKITLAHNGRIWLESKVGCGTTFFFTLSKPNQLAAPRPVIGTHATSAHRAAA
jgi:chemotaxis family two-component system sensor kinase Cph1